MDRNEMLATLELMIGDHDVYGVIGALAEVVEKRHDECGFADVRTSLSKTASAIRMAEAVASEQGV